MRRRSLPPKALMRRVGWNSHAARPADVFDERGLLHWRLVKSLLPSDLGLAGARILDFGCGAGRILRAAVADSPEAEFWGCDIDGPSVRWLQADLGDRARVFEIEEWPPMSAPSAYFDVVFAFSVFTHLVDSWSAWLLEVRRVLKPDGLAVITVFGPGHDGHSHGSEPISEDFIGLNVMYSSASWDRGGPLVVHSEWWLRAHWSRAFEIVTLMPGDPPGAPPLFGQGVLVMRPLPV